MTSETKSKTATSAEDAPQLEPYPTGDPLDPMAAVWIAHPELKPVEAAPPPAPEPEVAKKGGK